MKITTNIFDYVSPETLAELTGMDLEYIHGIKNGNEITQEFVEKVIAYIDEPLDKLFGFGEKM